MGRIWALLLCFLLVPPALWAEGDLFLFGPGGNYLVKVSPVGNSALVTLADPKDLKALGRWEIPGFAAQTLEFSANRSGRLLLASDDRILVYDLTVRPPKEISNFQVPPGEKITKVSFAPDRDEVYWTSEKRLHKNNADGTKTETLAEVNEGIVGMAPLKDRRVALAKKNSAELILVGEGQDKAPEVWATQGGDLVGLASPEGQKLFSLDQNNRLINWDLFTKKPAAGYDLEPESSPQKATGLGLDDRKKQLYVAGEKDGTESIKSYRITDLLNKTIAPKPERLVRTGQGGIYQARRALEPSRIDELMERIEALPSQPPSGTSTNQNGPFQLAQIEAKNGDLDKALSFINQVPVNSQDYAASRELQREIYQKIEQNNELESGKEQFGLGNYQSAKIILEGVLAKQPEQREARKYLAMTDKRLFDEQAGNWFLGILGTLILGTLSWFLWGLYQKKGAQFINQLIADPEDKRRLLLKIVAARELLNKRREQDKMSWYHGRLGEIERQLDWAEAQVNQAGVALSELITLVGQLHTEMVGMVKKASPKTSSSKPAPETAQRVGLDKDSGPSPSGPGGAQTFKKEVPKSEPRKKASKSAQPETPSPGGVFDESDYYMILGVGPDSTDAEVKKAYRDKLKEYHPDRHDASGYSWVKDEAIKMTLLVQDAYKALKTEAGRKKYARSRKA